jgi:hypothetical protein
MVVIVYVWLRPPLSILLNLILGVLWLLWGLTMDICIVAEYNIALVAT